MGRKEHKSVLGGLPFLNLRYDERCFHRYFSFLILFISDHDPSMKQASLKVLAPLALVALLGAGCAGSSPSEGPKTTTNTDTPKVATGQNNPNPNVPVATDDHAGSEHVAKLAGSRIDVKGKSDLKTGDVELSFKLYGEDGHAFGPNDLKIRHEKKLHLLLIRDDMTRFQHLHPEYTNGSWTVKTAIPDQGKYQMYADVAPIEEVPSVLRVPLTIGGDTQNTQVPVPNADWSAQDGEYTAKLTIDQPLKTKETKQWAFVVTQNGKPVTNLKPYLAAYGHVVELRHTDPDDFFHVHPVTENQPTDGKVIFEGAFPVKGRYTLYTQFNVNGSIKTFPITVDVNEVGEGEEVHSGHE